MAKKSGGENYKNIVKILDDVNDVDKFHASNGGEKHSKNLKLCTKNPQSALINVWRTSGRAVKQSLKEYFEIV
jgi:hypothetical protein